MSSELKAAILYEELGFTDLTRDQKIKAVAAKFGLSHYEAWLLIGEEQEIISSLIATSYVQPIPKDEFRLISLLTA